MKKDRKKTGGRRLSRIDWNGLSRIKSILETIEFACNSVPDKELKETILNFCKAQHEDLQENYKEY